VENSLNNSKKINKNFCNLLNKSMKKIIIKPKKIIFQDITLISTKKMSTYNGESEKLQDNLSNSDKNIALWLFICCGIILVIIVLGGVTRLTESGLSITEWKPVTGILPPLNQEEWGVVFDNYKQSPEYKMLNFGMTLEEFKKIYYMEWAHRIAGRLIGLAFSIPLLFFFSKGWIKGKLLIQCIGLLSLGGLQGALGWYMVKSGLDASNFKENNSVPRVSQYRLAAHLANAVVLYSSMFWMGMKLLNPIPYPKLYSISGISFLQRLSVVTTGLVFITALSGAFVAGLDAGLVYNTFPLMANQIIPEGLLKLKPTWKNFFENDTTVQFDHRLLGISTFVSSSFLYFLFLKKRKEMPKKVQIALHSLFCMTLLQVTLGITTLLTYVPVPLAASHQAGAMSLLTIALWATQELKKLPRIK